MQLGADTLHAGRAFACSDAPEQRCRVKDELQLNRSSELLTSAGYGNASHRGVRRASWPLEHPRGNSSGFEIRLHLIEDEHDEKVEPEGQASYRSRPSVKPKVPNYSNPPPRQPPIALTHTPKAMSHRENDLPESSRWRTLLPKIQKRSKPSDDVKLSPETKRRPLRDIDAGESRHTLSQRGVSKSWEGMEDHTDMRRVRVADQEASTAAVGNTANPWATSRFVGVDEPWSNRVYPASHNVCESTTLSSPAPEGLMTPAILPLENIGLESASDVAWLHNMDFDFDFSLLLETADPAWSPSHTSVTEDVPGYIGVESIDARHSRSRNSNAGYEEDQERDLDSAASVFTGLRASHPLPLSDAETVDSNYSHPRIRRPGRRKDRSTHACPQPGCAKWFERESDLRHHMRSHIPKDKRQFRCQTCQDAFNYPKELKRHEAKHSRSTAEVFRCEIPDCEYAQKGFPQKFNLQRHMQRKHPQEYDKMIEGRIKATDTLSVSTPESVAISPATSGATEADASPV